MAKVRVSGLRGRSSPMNTATPEQAATIKRLVEEGRERADYMIEVRYSTYIGPGCAADRGDITIIMDGKIWMMVMQDGRAY